MVKSVIGKQPYLVINTVNGHEIIADEPLDKGGGNKSAGPKDLLLASLGSCTCITVSMYANQKKWPLEKVEVELNLAEDDRDGIHYSKIDRHVIFYGPLDDAQRKRLLDIANHCPVHKILTGKIEIITTG